MVRHLSSLCVALTFEARLVVEVTFFTNCKLSQSYFLQLTKVLVFAELDAVDSVQTGGFVTKRWQALNAKRGQTPSPPSLIPVLFEIDLLDCCESALTVLHAIKPHADILATVGVAHNSMAFLLVFFPFTVVNAAVAESYFAVAMAKTISPHSFVSAFVHPDEYARPVSLFALDVA